MDLDIPLRPYLRRHPPCQDFVRWYRAQDPKPQTVQEAWDAPGFLDDWKVWVLSRPETRPYPAEAVLQAMLDEFGADEMPPAAAPAVMVADLAMEALRTHGAGAVLSFFHRLSERYG